MIEYTAYQENDEISFYVSEVLNHLNRQDIERDYLEEILNDDLENFDSHY